jgi:P27 family predicted phage terminase small subunit
MGKRGTIPQPTALKIAKGDRKDRINFDEPQPNVPQKPDPTQPVSAKIRAHFDILATRLQRQRVLTENDIELLTMFVIEHNGYEENYKIVQEEGSVIVNVQGNKVISPHAYLMQKHLAQCITLAKHFGFTPASRTDIKTIDKQQTNTFDLLKKVK